MLSGVGIVPGGGSLSPDLAMNLLMTEAYL